MTYWKNEKYWQIYQNSYPNASPLCFSVYLDPKSAKAGRFKVKTGMLAFRFHFY